MQRLTTGGWRPDGARGLVEVLLVLALSAQAARLIWAIATPALPPPPAAVLQNQDDLTILTRFNPFLGAEGPTGATSGDGLRLYGVRAAGAGAGSAIIGTADGRQASYLVGETVAPGVVLKAVESDHVVLVRGGVPSSLTFPNAPQ
ncbi:MAG: type II secretion pathway protein C [Caulobacter sp.]|nr:type II secretion pathway protein C [Caulobacter sp.]